MRIRRLLSAICCLAMLITLLPSTALAADPEIDTSTYDFISDDVAYKKVSDSTVEVAVYQKKGGESGVTFMGSLYDGKNISIPATVTYNDVTYTVVGIGASAFATSKPTSVTLAEGITYLGENSFTACNTTSLNIPASVKKIGNNAFYDSKVSSITFSEDSQLEEIGDGAFSSCTNLTSLTLPSSVKKIGGAVFASCTKLSSITIPASVTDLDPSVFGQSGSSMTPYYGNGHTITFAEGSKYKLQNGILYDDESLLNVYEVQGSVSVPEGIKYIGDRAFWNATGLTSITFPSTLVSIGNSAFNGSGLTSVTIPASVTSLGESAFMNCTSLTTATVNASIDVLPNYTFSCCSSLASVTLPSGLTSIGNYAFGRQSGTSISTCLTSIDIPASVTSIGTGAFRYCTSLESIDLPSGLTSLGENAFQNTGLTSIVIPEGITTIPTGVFSLVTSLKTVILTGDVTSVGMNAFSGWKSSASGCTLVMANGAASGIDAKAFGVQSGSGVTPNGLTVITTSDAVESCKQITQFSDAEKVTVSGFGLTATTIPTLKVASAEETEPTGNTTTLTADVPNGCTLTAEVADPSIATAAVGADGKTITVTSVGAGETTITVKITLNSPSYILLEKTLDVTVVAAPVPATGITLNETSVTLYPVSAPNTVTLQATVEPSGSTDTVTWESSDTDVATVENGVVTAHKVGSATITAKAGNYTDTCAITVAYAPAASVILSEASLSLPVKGTATLEASVTPEDADPAIVWSSSDGNVATVDENGVVTAVGEGEATITATAGGMKAVCVITVTNEGAVLPAVEEPETNTDKIAEADKQTASDVAGSVAADETISSAAQSAANSLNNSSDKEELISKGNAKLEPDEGETVSLYTQTYLTIEATDLTKDENSNVTSITLDITPMVRVVASTATNSADIKLDSGDETNAVVVKDAEALKITAPAEITVTLPSIFGGEMVYVKHIAGSGTYFYRAEAEDNGTLTFTSHHGFSPFTFSLTNEAVAEVDGVGYASFQEAVNAAANGDTVEILKAETLTATVSGSSRTITVKNSTGGEITVTLNGQAMTLANDATQEYTYTRPSSSGGGSSVTSYAVTTPSKVNNGTVKVSSSRASKGTTVTITVTPDEGYELDELTVTDSKGNELDLTNKGSGKYTFTMPASAVEVEVSFQEIVVEPVNPFTDVSTSDYYYEAVLWAVKNGVTNGTSATTFSPSVTVSRAQMVTFLWRAHGSPKATGTNPFTDVSASDYYYDAVLWAVDNGITNGTSATTFDPAAPVTRAQAVTFQWRAAGSPAVSGSSFDDVAADAYYVNAVTWAVANGITNGTGGSNFSPDAVVSRAQAVTFLWRERA